MKSSYVIDVLRTLDVDELRDFGRWLASPFFNTRQDVVHLYTYLSKGKHLLEAKYLDRNRVFKKIFPQDDYNDAKLRQAIHFLGKQLESFLAYQQVADEKYAFDLAYLKSLRKRKLGKVFTKKANAVRKTGIARSAQGSTGLRHAFMLYDEEYTLLLGLNKVKLQHLQQTVDMFDRQFIANKLKYACLELSHNRVFKTNYRSRFLENVLNIVQGDVELLGYPAITIYFFGYQMQATEEVAQSEEYYFKFKAAMQSFTSIFSEEEQKDIYWMALNYCVAKMNKGEQLFLAEAFELYMEGVSSGILLPGKRLSMGTFFNTVSIGLRIKKYTEVQQFIDEYSIYLHESDREVEKYGRAKLYYEKQKLSGALELLSTLDSKNMLISLNAKSMMLKIFYELQEYDALESFLESFRVYLTRKEIIGYHKPIYGNLIKYTRRLLRVNAYDKDQVNKLRQEIEMANPLPERPWLLEQLEKL